MITGHSTMRRVGEARDVGVTEFLSKPVTARGVIERITRVVDHPRSFVRTSQYFGPDRRRRQEPAWPGPFRRSTDKQTTDID
jgi:two-component system, chemotaxis family, chemotaxis protein CheY